MYATVTIDVNSLGDYPIEVEARVEYEPTPQGMVWSVEVIRHVDVMIADQPFDIINKVSKNEASMAALLKELERDVYEDVIYQQLKKHYYECNPFASLTDSLMHSRSFRVRTA